MSLPSRRSPLHVLALALLLLAAAVPGLARLRLDTRILGLLPDDLPEVRGLTLHERHFSAARDLWITVASDDPEAVAATTRRLVDRLRARPDLAGRVVDADPLSGRPADWAPLLAWIWLNQPPEEFARLLARLEPDAAATAFEEARETLAGALSGGEIALAATDPLGFSRLPGELTRPAGNPFRSADGRFQVIEVQPARELSGYPAVSGWLDSVRDLVNAADGSGPGGSVRIRFTGGPAFTAEIARGMERDMTASGLGTLGVVGLLFWVVHRTWRPLLRLNLLLGATILLTLAAGGWIWGSLNVVSLGFAAILLGLVVDYGLITWQERRSHPGLRPVELLRRVGPPIAWSAVTTAGAFAVVTAAGLPGLRQLGGLVALGTLAGAVLMPWGFAHAPIQPPGSAPAPAAPAGDRAAARHRRLAFGVAGVVALLALAILASRGWPRLDTSAAPLRPRQSEAHAAMEEWGRRTGRDGTSPLWLVVPGGSPDEVAARLDRARAILGQADTAGRIRSFQLPDALWPRPAHQRANLMTARQAAARIPDLERVAAGAGFTPQALRLTRSVLEAWRDWPTPAGPGTPVAPPASDGAAWLMAQVAGHGPDGWVALGRADPAPGADPSELTAELAAEGIWLTSWERLGPALLTRVTHRLPWLAGTAALIVAGSLLAAFRTPAALLLSVASLALSGLVLLAGMSLAGMHWNLMNLTAIPLGLGLGVDYSIHVLAAARRGGMAGGGFRWGVGGALLLCGATTVTGFASLATGSNAGLASLGLVCAGAVAANLAVALLWLPRVAPAPSGTPAPPGPSSLYRAGPWRAGVLAARHLPRSPLALLAAGAAALHARLDPGRFATVTANLRPLVPDERAARHAARRLYRNFGRKLVDLWRLEAGRIAPGSVVPGDGWRHYHDARATGRGVLLVTPHLGNWELGTRLLADLGESPLVVSAREPGPGFTELRESARHRTGTRTVVVGEDPFAFVPVVRHLQDGGVAALLVDRPAAPAAVPVGFLGRPFHAAISPAELARATGCVLLPVAVVWVPGLGHVAEALAPVDYDRAALNRREARAELAGRILRAFEPLLRKHPDQWYHFVPLWR